MITEDQTAVIAFLSSPAAHGGAPVEVVETHASVVFLAGERALKLKRAVRYDYLDFSTAALRRERSEAELAINRRTAPAIYRRVLPVTRAADGTLALDGAGEPVDWVLEMARFDQDLLFDRLATRHALPLDVMSPLGATIARFHRAAGVRRDHGGRQGLQWVVDGNAAAFAAPEAVSLDAAGAAALSARASAAIARHAALLDARRDAGCVRQCHGNLHLRNIVLLGGEPTLFDGVEFNDEIGCIDTWYDVSFLLMDLWRRGLTRHASVLFNAYLRESGDVNGLPLLPLFLSCRAAVRAKTSLAAAALASSEDARRSLQHTAAGYLQLALSFLEPPEPSLLAVGGFSGTGKSTLALALAPRLGSAPGAAVIRSDEIRKRLAGVSPSTRLTADDYTDLRSQRVYAAAMEEATRILDAGHAVIVDAVFQRASDRRTVAGVAAACRVPFAGVWLEAPLSLLVARVEQRAGDASDARAAVVRAQAGGELGELSWLRVEASGTPGEVCRRAAAALRTSGLTLRDGDDEGPDDEEGSR